MNKIYQEIDIENLNLDKSFLENKNCLYKNSIIYEDISIIYLDNVVKNSMNNQFQNYLIFSVNQMINNSLQIIFKINDIFSNVIEFSFKPKNT